MKDKKRHYLRQTVNAIIIAGIVILIIGLYYFMIKAGIPYQDPPLDLWLQYEVNARIGNILMGIGIKIIVFGSIFRFVLELLWRNCMKK